MGDARSEYLAVNSGFKSDVEANSSDATGAAKPKERLAYLDHVKFACMVAIFMMHSMSEPFAYCKDDSFWKGGAPVWLQRVQNMHAQFGLPIFALCSGAVSKPDISVDRILTYIRQLAVPVVLMYYWYEFVFFMPAGKEFPSWPVQQVNLIGLHNNFLWYLKALFVWRVVLMLGGPLPDWLLVLISLIARSWACTWSFGYSGPAFVGQTFLLFPFYIIGYVLFSKRKLLEPFVMHLRNNNPLRIAAFIAYVLLWVDVGFFGFGQKLTMQGYTYMRMGKGAHIMVDLVLIPISLAYGFVATAWLPTSELPVFSEAGRQTLYCYMFNTTGVMCFYNLWRYLSRPMGDPIWLTWVLFQPLMVIALSCAPLRFIVWPFASPGWAMKNPIELTLEKATEEKWVKQVGFLIWLLITVVVHVAFVFSIKTWGSPRDCAA